MNSLTLLNLVLHPEKAQETDLDALQELVNEYPYFQAARMLIAKITKDSAHIKTAAAYTSERTVLQQIINSEFNPDINLPNIDNLEIGKDDLHVFDKLSKEEAELKPDSDFNEQFENIDIETPNVDTDNDSLIDDLLEEQVPDSSVSDSEIIQEDTPEITIPVIEIPDASGDVTVPETETTQEEEDDTSPFNELLPDDLEQEAEDKGYELDGSMEDDLAEFYKLKEEAEKSRLAAEAAMDAQMAKMNGEVEDSESQQATHEPLPEQPEEEALDPSLLEGELAEFYKLKQEAEKNRLAAEAAMDAQMAKMNAEKENSASTQETLSSLEELEKAVEEPIAQIEETDNTAAIEETPVEQPKKETIDPALLEGELAEIYKLKQEAEKNRLVAEAAMDAQMEKVKAEREEAKAAEEKEQTATEEIFNSETELPETEYEMPDYDNPLDGDSTDNLTDITTTLTDETIPNPQDIEETPLEISNNSESSEDLDIFGEKEIQAKPMKKSPFSFDDSLFSLDSLLEQASAAIDPIKELEKQPVSHELPNSPETNEVQAKQVNLIDEFIDKTGNKRIKPDQLAEELVASGDLAVPQKKGIVSENLATIMIKQGKYVKAIEIYQELILKFPEKKAYFAGLIQNLEKHK